MRRAALITVALALSACIGPKKFHARQDPGEWMNSARDTVSQSCTDEADGTGATGDVWQHVYSNCAAKAVNELLLSDDRPDGTSCDVKPTWCVINGPAPPSQP